MSGKAGHRGFGYVRKLPSKRHQASYLGPDGKRHTAYDTFGARMDAEAWLATEHRLVASHEWTAPAVRRAARDAEQIARQATLIPLADYAAAWLRERELKPRTRALYRDLLDRQIRPELGKLPVAKLTPAIVRE